MDKKKILQQIKSNKLDTLEYAFMVAQLCVINNKPYVDMQKIVDELIHDGDIVKREEAVEVDYSKSRPVAEKATILDDAEKMLYNDVKKDKRKEKKLSRLEGKLQGTQKGYAFLIPNDINMDDVFIPMKSLNGAMNNDQVIVEVFAGRNGKNEGKVVQITERGNQHIVGKISVSKKFAYVSPDDVKFGKDIFVPIQKINGAKDGDKVLVKIEKYYAGNKNPDGSVTEVLGRPNEIITEVKAVIRSYGLFDSFPKNVRLATSEIPTEIDKTRFEGRKDLRKDLIFTIDGEDTRDIDDAISLTMNDDGTYHLGVHIADVGEYVKLNSVFDKEAFKRATSVYFPGLVLPMLPREFSNGICSLNEREDRFALSCVMDINEKGEVKHYDIFESIINSKRRYTYTEVQKVLDGDKEALERNKDFNETLNNMNDLHHILLKARENRGAIDFNFPEVEIVLDDLGNVTDLKRRERDDSHRLIESFMIVANETIAEHFCKAKLPFVYRIHENPSEEKMNTFLSLVNAQGIETTLNPHSPTPMDLKKILEKADKLDSKDMINKVCLRSLRKAKYSNECLGHFGIASTYYCHFTSPIRRYPDLTIHRIIKDSINCRLVNQKLTETKNFVVASSMQSSEREVEAEEVERAVDDLYKVFYMSNHLDEEFEAKVSSVVPFGLFVELGNTVEGLVKLADLPDDIYDYREDEYSMVGKSHSYKIGQPIKVKAVRADILSREIDMLIVE